MTGSRRLRFIADVYGITQISDLEERQKNATAQDIIEYLAGSKRYAIGGLTDPNDKNSFTVGEGYTQKELLNIIAIRYTMGTTGYQKYIRLQSRPTFQKKPLPQLQKIRTSWRAFPLRKTQSANIRTDRIIPRSSATPAKSRRTS